MNVKKKIIEIQILALNCNYNRLKSAPHTLAVDVCLWLTDDTFFQNLPLIEPSGFLTRNFHKLFLLIAHRLISRKITDVIYCALYNNPSYSRILIGSRL